MPGGMRRFLRCLALLRTGLGKIHPVDRGLLLFLAVLLSQSAYSLFVPGGESQFTGDIDIIVRTSSAAIFGYLLSGNFIDRVPAGCSCKAVSKTDLTAPTEGPAGRLRGQIGFTDGETTPAAGSAQGTGSAAPPAVCCLQIVTATAIGLFCLGVLIALRNLAPADDPRLTSPAVTAIVAQLRDFVSGCVGFLIGIPTRSAGD